MKPTARWSLAGIDADVRAAAEHAARRAGMTPGRWLSTVIRRATTADVGTPTRSAEVLVHPAARSRETAIDDLLADIRRLTREIADSEARALAAIAPLSERVKRLSVRVSALRLPAHADLRPLDEAASRIRARLAELEDAAAAPSRSLFDRRDD